jgi:malate dehydrogenase (NAD) (EC 1.1.1.37)
MAEAIKRDARRSLIASVVLQGEYGVSDVPVEVPIVLGRSGVLKILEVELTPEESQKFMQSVEAIKKLISSIPSGYLQ